MRALVCSCASLFSQQICVWVCIRINPSNLLADQPLEKCCGSSISQAASFAFLLASVCFSPASQKKKRKWHVHFSLTCSHRARAQSVIFTDSVAQSSTTSPFGLIHSHYCTQCLLRLSGLWRWEPEEPIRAHKAVQDTFLSSPHHPFMSSFQAQYIPGSEKLSQDPL